MGGMKALLLFGVAWLTGQCVFGQISEPVSRAATVDELYDLLGVTVHAGSFQFRKSYKTISMVFEGVAKGRVVFTASAGSMMTDPGVFEPATCNYVVTIVDLDTLPLGGGRPGFCRVLVRFFCKPGGGTGAFTDVAKADLDLTGGFNAEPIFGRRADIPPDADGRTPVFRLVSSDVMVPKTGPDGKTAFDFVRSDKKLSCYFIGK